MEFRDLKYFLAIAKEGSVTKAANSLYLSQPTLSRQMAKLEEELGKQLFIRNSKSITLTEAGLRLYKRAEEIFELYEMTQKEMLLDEQAIMGDIYIGSGESLSITPLAKVMVKMKEAHPGLSFHLYSGDAFAIEEKLTQGLIDFGVLVEPVDLSKYDFISLPMVDTWGILMRNDDLLASKEAITPEDVNRQPLILSEQSLKTPAQLNWFKRNVDKLNIAATYNLVYNASILVKEGMGYALTLKDLVNTSNSDLIFKPLNPSLESRLVLVYKKYQNFSKASKAFLEEIISSSNALKN